MERRTPQVLFRKPEVAFVGISVSWDRQMLLEYSLVANIFEQINIRGPQSKLVNSENSFANKQSFTTNKTVINHTHKTININILR